MKSYTLPSHSFSLKLCDTNDENGIVNQPLYDKLAESQTQNRFGS